MPRDRQAEFYTVGEAADVLGVSVSTVWRWIEADKLPAYRLGPKAIRIRKHDLRAAVRPVAATRKKVTAVIEEMAVLDAVRPLTSEESNRGLRILEEARALRQELRSRRGGEPLPSSWQLIRRARAERSKRP